MTFSSNKSRTLFHILMIATNVFVVNVKTCPTSTFSKFAHYLPIHFVHLSKFQFPHSLKPTRLFLTFFIQWDIIKLMRFSKSESANRRPENGSI